MVSLASLTSARLPAASTYFNPPKIIIPKAAAPAIIKPNWYKRVIYAAGPAS